MKKGLVKIVSGLGVISLLSLSLVIGSDHALGKNNVDLSEKVTLHVMMSSHPWTKDAATIPMFQDLEKKMNMQIISAKDYGEGRLTLETGRAAAYMMDDVLLAGELVGVEFRFLQDVGEDIDRQRHVVGKHAGIEGRGLDAGGRVDLAADVLDLRGDLEGAAPLCSLEGHVLEQMGHAMLFVALVSRPGFDPGAESDGFKVWKRFGGDRQAVRQTAYLNTHMDFTPCATSDALPAHGGLCNLPPFSGPMEVP